MGVFWGDADGGWHGGLSHPLIRRTWALWPYLCPTVDTASPPEKTAVGPTVILMWVIWQNSGDDGQLVSQKWDVPVSSSLSGSFFFSCQSGPQGIDFILLLELAINSTFIFPVTSYIRAYQFIGFKRLVCLPLDCTCCRALSRVPFKPGSITWYMGQVSTFKCQIHILQNPNRITKHFLKFSSLRSVTCDYLSFLRGYLSMLLRTLLIWYAIEYL